MKRSMLAFLGVMVLVGATAHAQTASVVGSKHDLRTTGGATATPTSNQTEVCVSCHTPHMSTLAAGQDPLWNHTATTTAAFGIYNSATFNGFATAADIGGGAIGSQSVSMLCMSCHDGTVAVASQYNPQNGITYTITAVAGRIDATGKIISNANMGTSLTDDHPVNFTYDAALVTADGALKDPTVAPVLPLLIGGKVQCSSCHDVHNTAWVAGMTTQFMVMNNTGSALCLTCHTK